ncbi:MAG: peptidoglycan editing factor PgeF [Rhodoblastus sp.]
MNLPIIQSKTLAAAGVNHAFFTRAGGVSEGVYATLNGGVGSSDARENVAENRRRMAETMGVAADRFLVPFQIHSPDCLVVDGPWTERPRCDGLATATPGLALGVTGADCGMVLFADPKAKVVGACHSGWKGALTGVVEATIAAMEKLGAHRSNTIVALGPTIGPASYEVGPEFFARFAAQSADHARFFAPSAKDGHKMFDLPAFIGFRAEQAGAASFENLGLDTYSDEARFYSYRRTTHRKEPDYGRLVSAVAA